MPAPTPSQQSLWSSLTPGPMPPSPVGRGGQCGSGNHTDEIIIVTCERELKCFELVRGAGEAWSQAVASGRVSEGRVNGVEQRERSLEAAGWGARARAVLGAENRVECTGVVLVTVESTGAFKAGRGRLWLEGGEQICILKAA